MEFVIGFFILVFALALAKTSYEILVLKQGLPYARKRTTVRRVAGVVRSIGVSSPPVPGLRRLELRMLDVINLQRRQHGLGGLTWDDRLSSVARWHCLDMAKRNFFSHVNPEGEDHVRRLDRFGVDAVMSGENIARGCQTVEEAHEGFMRSPGHRANCMEQRFTHAGVGIIPDPNNGGLVVTQVFLRRSWE